MMHEDGGRALLGDELERGRQLHAQGFLGGQELEQLRVVLEVGAGAVAPRVALPPLRVVSRDDVDPQKGWDEREEVLEMSLDDAVRSILRNP